MSKLRFGVIGCAGIGRLHARLLAELDEAELVGLGDVLEAPRRELAENLGVSWHGSVEALLDRDDVDIVNVCVPTGFHADVAIRAMEAGKHVIVEKPIDRLIETSQRTKQTLAAIFNYRFNRASLAVKSALEKGHLGRPLLGNAYIKWWRGQEYFDRGAWRGTWRLDGGGCLMNQGVHFIDLLQWFMGPVKALHAYTATLAHRCIEVEDVAVAHIKFQNGALGTIEATTAAKPHRPGRVELYGTEGSIVLEEREIKEWNLEAEPEFPPTGPESHEAEFLDVISAIQSGRPPLVTGSEARKAVEIILFIYESVRSRREVVLPPTATTNDENRSTPSM